MIIVDSYLTIFLSRRSSKTYFRHCRRRFAREIHVLRILKANNALWTPNHNATNGRHFARHYRRLISRDRLYKSTCIHCLILMVFRDLLSMWLFNNNLPVNLQQVEIAKARKDLSNPNYRFASLVFTVAHRCRNGCDFWYARRNTTDTPSCYDKSFI